MDIKSLRSGIEPQNWQQGQTGDVSGYKGYDSYPVAFQAADFPKYGNTRITGNSQAFFFVEGIKKDGQVVDIQLQTKHLKTLIANTLQAEDRPQVSLQIDADVFENPEVYVDKYQKLRSEPEEATRRELLGKEAQMIREFVNEGGIKALVKETMQELAEARNGKKLPENALETMADGFLKNNFHLEGLRTQEPLQFATWEVETSQGQLLARQEYKDSTYMADRPWQIGLAEELNQLKEKGHTGAEQVIEATDHTRDLPKIELTHGNDHGHEQAQRTGRGGRQ